MNLLHVSWSLSVINWSVVMKCLPHLWYWLWLISEVSI